jgi:hypothetical protein
MKLPLDDPYHTDWTIGAGLDPSGAYDERVSEVSTRLMFELQERLGRFEAGVVVDAGPVAGVVVIRKCELIWRRRWCDRCDWRNRNRRSWRNRARW